MSNQATQPPPLPGTLAARPPQSIEAEQAVLGAMLLSKEAIDIVVELLEVDYFYRPAHRKLFKAIVSLYEKNEPVDLITVADELTAKGWLKDVGGRAYLAGLAEASPSVVNVAHHARIVADKAARNLLCRAAETMLASANDEAKDIDEILDLTEQQVFSIKERKLAGTIRPMEEILYDVLQNAENAQQHGAAGLSSGFADLDRLTSGFQKADLILIACRPSVGKTAFALNIAEHLAVDKNIPVLIFSIEMKDEALVGRLLCGRTKISSHKLRNGWLSDQEWTKLAEAVEPLSRAPLYIDCTPGITLLDIRAKARRYKLKHGIGLVIIDYLQLIAPPRAENRQNEVSVISRSLKQLAGELDVPVIALSQLSRQVEIRGNDARPRLSDLRESGSLEQDADLVIFIHRPRDESGHWGSEAEIIVAKQRNGPTGKVDLTFVKPYARFELAENGRLPEDIYRGD